MAWKSCGALLLDHLGVAPEHERIETARAFCGGERPRTVGLQSMNSYFILDFLKICPASLDGVAWSSKRRMI
jgi:hypothetical protein